VGFLAKKEPGTLEIYATLRVLAHWRSLVPVNKTLYVNNLRQSADLSDLEDLFSTVGDVETRRLEAHLQSLNGAGYGVFEMATERQAADCIERFNGSTALGQTLSVSAAKPECRPAKMSSGRRK